MSRRLSPPQRYILLKKYICACIYFNSFFNAIAAFNARLVLSAGRLFKLHFKVITPFPA